MFKDSGRDEQEQKPTHRSNTRSSFFAQPKLRRDMLPEVDVNKFQDEYVAFLSERTNENAGYAKLPFNQEEKPNEIVESFRNFRFTITNTFRIVTVLVLSAILAVCVYLPTQYPTIWAALESGAKTTDYNFSVDTAYREHPEYAKNVSLTAGGVTQTFDTSLSTVSQIVRDKNIHISLGYDVYPDLNALVGDNTEIIVDKPVIKSAVVVEEIPKDTITTEDGAVRVGEVITDIEGQNGKYQNTYIVKQIGEHELSRTQIASTVLTPKIDQAVRVGTLVPVDQGTIVTVPDSDVKKYALEQIRARGWGDSEFTCLESLWMKESGWRATAGNVISGAYGIPQALPGSKMSSEGADWETNPMTQVRWGLGYIAGRYSTPCGAWGTWQSNGWY
ncbi:hypothetical protein FACS1894125_5460 [Actinomycetota bacterium]|nr:hypothetical protein FACS1894125_5460 [Actinomycetota bacterium]